MKLKRRIITIIDYVILVFLAVIILIPLLWLLGNSFKTSADINANMGKIFPSDGKLQFGNYVEAWERGLIGEHLLNSLIITISSVLLILVLTYLVSYAVTRIRFKGSEIIYAIFVSLMLVPLGQVVMIPQYRIISSLHLVDTYLGVVLLYTAGGIPFSVFLLSSFLRKIPIELDEAAFIDGCGRLQNMIKIVLPLSKPGMATIIIYQGMAVWNDYYTALIYLRTKRTVTLGLKNFMGNWGMVDYHLLFAAIAMLTIPIVILFIVFQKQFISGLTAGSVKG